MENTAFAAMASSSYKEQFVALEVIVKKEGLDRSYALPAKLIADRYLLNYEDSAPEDLIISRLKDEILPAYLAARHALCDAIHQQVLALSLAQLFPLKKEEIEEVLLSLADRLVYQTASNQWKDGASLIESEIEALLHQRGFYNQPHTHDPLLLIRKLLDAVTPMALDLAATTHKKKRLHYAHFD